MIRVLDIAFAGLMANKGRSILTMLGIIIGVASVVSMIAIGSGAQHEVESQIKSLGANLLQIQPIERNTTQHSRNRSHQLSESDAHAIRLQIPEVAHVAPAVQEYAVVINGSRNLEAPVVGAVPEHLFAREWNVTYGRIFSNADVHNAARVAVVGARVASALYGSQSIVGQQIRIGTVPFDIIGVLEKKGQSPFGHDQDEIVFVPLSTAKMRVEGSAHQVNPDAVEFIYIKVGRLDDMAAAQARIKSLLRQRHGITSDDQKDDFQITDLVAMMRVELEAGNTFTLLLASIAAVSLLVGGISIMNIMIVTVTERTHEIGLRLAVGAQRKHIRNQFLIEAIALCLIGGLAGIVVGIVIVQTIAFFANWQVIIEWWAIVLSFGFSALVGVFFGFYPALMASRLDPVIALRAE